MNKDQKACLDYLEQYWERVTFENKEGEGVYIGLPYPFVSPNDDIFRYDQFYWDTYFVIVGLVADGKVQLAKGMVENLRYLFQRFGLMPHRNRMYNLGTSQPPFFTSMALEVYNAEGDKAWLKKMAATAEAELEQYWINPSRTELHVVYEGLSRYCDHFITDHTAEHESGWDMTSRFNSKALSILPVDLNCCLYKYERDLFDIYTMLGEEDKARSYERQANIRRFTINELMWSKRKKFFFDFNFEKKKRNDFWSLAGYYPLWCGLATKDQAKKLRDNLDKFEEKWGLANSQPNNLMKPFRQWDYPNGWPNQQWIVVDGLNRYGFKEDAERIALKWLEVNMKIFQETGKFWEKYDVVTGEIGKTGAYKTQDGFSWSNAIFIKFAKMYWK